MNQWQVNRWERRLSREVPWLGRWLIRRAIRTLARDDSPEAARLLAQCAVWQRDPLIHALVLDRLREVAGGAHIDGICAVWAASRHPVLAKLICHKEWVASTPDELRVLTALKTGAISPLTHGGPEVVEALIGAGVDRDPEIASRAREALARLANQAAIDSLCQRWAASREDWLGQIIAGAGHVATEPVAARVLSALKAGKPDVAGDGGAEFVAVLLAASEDADAEVRRAANVALRQLRRPEARDALCRRVLENNESLAREVALSTGYAPSDPTERAAFYFLTEQWREYGVLDFDQRLLAAAYESGSKRLRGRIAEKARQAGRTEWIAVIAAGRQERRLAEMTDDEWEAAMALLSESQRWPEMWRLAQAAPADWSVRMLMRLRENGWRPDEARAKEGFARLAELAWRCQSEPPFLGRLLRHALPLLGHQGRVTCLAMTRDSQWVISGGEDGTVRVWSLSDGKCARVLAGHEDAIAGVTLSPDERWLASGAWDGTLAVWSLPEGALVHKITAHEQEIRCLAFCGKDRVATASGDGSVRIWRVADGQNVARLREHSDLVSCIAASPDGRVLATGSYDATICLWELPDAIHMATLSDHRALVNCLAFTPDSRFLASGSKDRTVLIWDVAARQRVSRFKGHRDDVGCLAYRPDGSMLASGSWDSTTRLWQLPHGEPVETLGALDFESGHSGRVTGVAFSPDGRVLATGGADGSVRLWSVPGGAPLKALEEHGGEVSGVAFSPDGRTLVSGGWDGRLCVWKSELVRLRRLPIAQLTFEDLDWTEKTLANSKLSDAERYWLELLHGLMLWRHRYDIEVGEREAIVVGEFDIEIALEQAVEGGRVR